MSCEKRINIEQKVNFHFKSSLTINASVQKIEYFTQLLEYDSETMLELETVKSAFIVECYK